MSQVTIAATMTSDYNALSATVGLVTILLLVLLLIGKELMRARGAATHVIGAFDVPIVPLLASAGVVLSLRLLDLLR